MEPAMERADHYIDALATVPTIAEAQRKHTAWTQKSKNENIAIHRAMLTKNKIDLETGEDLAKLIQRPLEKDIRQKAANSKDCWNV